LFLAKDRVWSDLLERDQGGGQVLNFRDIWGYMGWVFVKKKVVSSRVLALYDIWRIFHGKKRIFADFLNSMLTRQIGQDKNIERNVGA
jgi:hypothetical protein